MRNRPEFTDADLEKLIRALGEVRSLESEAAARPDREPRLVAADADLPTHRVRRRLWIRVVAGSFAAAACVLLQVRPGLQNHTMPIAVAGVPVRMSYLPEVNHQQNGRRDCVQSTPAEPCSVVAVLRTFSAECQCLVWDLYRWDTGTVIARAKPGEPVEVMTTPRQAPPSLSQVVVFAVARERDLLPSSGVDTERFLDCLLTESPASDSSAGLEQYATTVKACLPGDVTIVPQFLAAR